MSTAIKNLVFDVIDHCNLVCPSCVFGMRGGTRKLMSLETCKIVLDHSVKYFAPESLWPFNWGEPLLLDEKLPDYINLFAQYPIKLRFSSNMNKSLPDETVRLILRHAVLVVFSVSGMEQDIYKLYHRAGKIDQVMTNIRQFVRLRNETNSETVLAWTFGHNRFNASQEEPIRQFCAENGIYFNPNRYYITDAEDLHTLYNGGDINPKIYAPFYESIEEAREHVRKSATPRKCSQLYSDLVLDTDGYVMLCCSTKITTPVHVTEVTDTRQLTRTRLDNEFCHTCYDEGLAGYYGSVR